MKINLIGPTDPALTAALNSVAAHPEWNLTLNLIPWAEYRNVLMDTLAAETAPHQAVFVPGHVWIPELAAGCQIAGLNPLIARLGEAQWREYQWEGIIPSIRDESYFQGMQYMIPYFNDGQILFMRKDLFEMEASSHPLEISPLDLVSLAEKVHHPPEIYGVALKAHPSEIFFDWLPYLLAAGGELTDVSFQPAFASEEGQQALKAYCQLRAFAPPETHNFGNEEIAHVIRTGQSALVTTWGGQAAPIFLDKNNLYREKYQSAIFPHPCGATWGISIPANQPTEIQLNALEIVLALNSPGEDQRVLHAAGSPLRESSYTETAYREYSWLRAQREILDRFYLLPRDPRISLYLGPLTEALVKAFRGDLSSEDALRTAESRIKAELG